MASAAYQVQMAQLQDSHPKTKVEFIDLSSNVTDISAYYDSGANFQQIKERAAVEIQSGQFDVVLDNPDNKFSEYDSTSLLYNLQYHGAKIRISQGYVLADGSEEYVLECVGLIDELIADPQTSRVTFRCRDIIRRILDAALHAKPTAEVAVAGSSNIGNGFIGTVNTLPFKTKNETWTITCLGAGGDGSATFSVVGSTSGNIGTATSGTQFTSAAGPGGIKFTVSVGTIGWAVGDVFTLSTKQYPEWSGVNAAKIVWSVLTGYDWDTNTLQPWSGLVLNLDHTQSNANTDIDYNNFVAVIAKLTQTVAYNLTGYAAYNSPCATFLTNLMLLFLGALYTGQDGRLAIGVYTPTFNAGGYTAFSDALKITQLGYNRTIDEVINYVSIDYKSQLVWDFSDQSVTYQSSFVASSAASIAKYGQLSAAFQTIWYASNGTHVKQFGSEIVGKYAEPPVNVDFVTGGDALLSNIGDLVTITDAKYNLSAFLAEISQITKRFDVNPLEIAIRGKQDQVLTTTWGFLGSNANEGDGLSPQAATYDTATTSDKKFCYLGDGVSAAPAYYMF